VPNPRVKIQRFCGNQSCQKARKAKWQRHKMATDPDYQANQRDARQAWQRQNPTYWRLYRHKHPADCARHRLLQPHRDYKRRNTPRTKMDASDAVTFVNPGVYPLIPATAKARAKMDALPMAYRLIPMT
jgi:hypothetical protein